MMHERSRLSRSIFATLLLVAVPLLSISISAGATPSAAGIRTPLPATRNAIVKSLRHMLPAHRTAPMQHIAPAPRSPHPAALERLKDRLNAHAQVAKAPPVLSKAIAPINSSWEGLQESGFTPSDSTGAIGTSRYIELVNDQFGIYDRVGNSINTGGLNALTQDSNTLTDPQIIWDYSTNRFYYVILDESNDHLEIGFSKSNSPSSGSKGFCHYDVDFGFGSTFPDFPKLGDTSNYLMIGVNAFTGTNSAAVVAWLDKPVSQKGAITTCPSGSSIAGGQITSFNNADGSPAFTPVPSHQIDPSTQGYILTTRDISDGSAETYVSLWKVSPGTGAPSVVGPYTVTVPSFSIPPDAPQQGGNPLDTSDTRLTQAVTAFDPAHNGTAIWTQHTVATSDNTASQVDWYEIDPQALTLYQGGNVQEANAFVFNGAIAPDRQRNGSTFGFGEDMGLTFNVSSAQSYVSIGMVTKDGPTKQSAIQLIQSSTGDDGDGCFTSQSPDDCRWGDYPGASPDPLAQGMVWFTNMWVKSTLLGTKWSTWNWDATVAPPGGILRTVNPNPLGNGRAIAYDPSTRHLFYTNENDTNIYITNVYSKPLQTLSPGTNFGALSWDPTHGQLWGGAYDGSGNVYTVDPTTGAATLAFNFQFPPTDNCFGQAPGYIDGLAYDASDGTLWLSDDGGKVLYHVNTSGQILNQFKIPYNACNTGIAAVGNHLWLALITNEGSGVSYFLWVSKKATNVTSHVDGEVFYSGSGGPEGIAYQKTSGGCQLWVNPYGDDPIAAINVAPLC
jgi:hypothetical protein